MSKKDSNENGYPPTNRRLQNRVILIINGISENGRKLANTLAEHGADVAIAGTQKNSKLTDQISQEVIAKGQRCLVLTPDEYSANGKPFSQRAIQTIVETLGQIDSFIIYSAAEIPGETTNNGAAHPIPAALDFILLPVIFDKASLTSAALDHILGQDSR